MENQKIDYSQIYSPSKLGMFELCPKQYHFYYLDPIYSQMKNDLKRQPENIWSFQTLGKAVHDAITLFYHSPREQRTETKLKELLQQTWRSEVVWNKKPPLGKWGGFASLQGEREAYGQAILMLKNFLKMALIEPEIEYLPTQDLRHSITDYNDLITPLAEDFKISGKFDLVIRDRDGSCQIIDFKTGKREESQPFQLKFYKVLAEKKFQKPVKKASFYFLKTGHKKEFNLEEKTEQIEEEILAKINQINTTKTFTPKPSKLCRFCLFKSFCPAREKVKEFVQETTEEDYADDLPF